MANDPVEPMRPENEALPPEEPKVFSVVRDIHGTQFKRRDFIEKAVVTTAAVSVLATGCTSLGKSDNHPAPVLATETAPFATETATPVPTGTPVPPTPTITITPTVEGIETTIKGDKVNFRSGPGTNYPPITLLTYGTKIKLISRLADSSWVGVAFSNPNKPGSFVEGWIKTTLVDTRGKDIAGLRVITEIPPTPTPLPGKYGNTKPGEKGINYKFTDEFGNVYTYSLPCGSDIPSGATCTCNCVTVPRSCECVGHTTSSCTCNPIHYWYPN